MIRSLGGWEAVKGPRGKQERIKGDERILGHKALGHDYEWLVGQIASLFRIPAEEITRQGRYPSTVEARSVLCYWGVRELGMSTVEMSRRLHISQPTASQSVKRGEKVVAEKKLQLPE
ncbi:MAG: hypothetical protein JXL84_05310 [Deltaproteobacteria bacterium]|nr:hypothetical protein [Deltaproteobacteria bacterium]